MDAEEILEAIEKGDDATAIKSTNESGGMTLRERYRRTMFFQSVDKIVNFEFGYWAETLPEWHKQGLPTEITNEKNLGVQDMRF